MIVALINVFLDNNKVCSKRNRIVAYFLSFIKKDGSFNKKYFQDLIVDLAKKN